MKRITLLYTFYIKNTASRLRMKYKCATVCIQCLPAVIRSYRRGIVFTSALWLINKHECCGEEEVIECEIVQEVEIGNDEVGRSETRWKLGQRARVPVFKCDIDAANSHKRRVCYLYLICDVCLVFFWTFNTLNKVVQRRRRLLAHSRGRIFHSKGTGIFSFWQERAPCEEENITTEWWSRDGRQRTNLLRVLFDMWRIVEEIFPIFFFFFAKWSIAFVGHEYFVVVSSSLVHYRCTAPPPLSPCRYNGCRCWLCCCANVE